MIDKVFLCRYNKIRPPQGRTYAGMAELADAPDLGSGAARRAGSTPVTRTTPEQAL